MSNPLTRSGRFPIAFAAALAVGGCTGPPKLPPPQPVVLSSGARVRADEARLQEIHGWVLALTESISCSREVLERQPSSRPQRPGNRMRLQARRDYCLAPGAMIRRSESNPRGASEFRRKIQDPRTHIATIPADQDSYPWETLAVTGDTARVRYLRTHPDLRTPHMVYAFLHLMESQGRVDEWLPEAAGTGGYALERAIVKRVADAWLMGRSTLLVDPARSMDELMYASEAGYLDAFLFTARPAEFVEERERWLAANIDGLEEYRAWYRRTWRSDPPGPRTSRN